MTSLKEIISPDNNANNAEPVGSPSNGVLAISNGRVNDNASNRNMSQQTTMTSVGGTTDDSSPGPPNPSSHSPPPPPSYGVTANGNGGMNGNSHSNGNGNGNGNGNVVEDNSTPDTQSQVS